MLENHRVVRLTLPLETTRADAATQPHTAVAFHRRREREGTGSSRLLVKFEQRGGQKGVDRLDRWLLWLRRARIAGARGDAPAETAAMGEAGRIRSRMAAEPSPGREAPALRKRHLAPTRL